MQESTSCKNCQALTVGNYCSNCGQATDTHRLSAHYLWHDIQHHLLHFDKGVFYTIKELFTRPGYSIREYIEGKRIKHFRPISLVILLATLYGILSLYFHTDVAGGIKYEFSENGAAAFQRLNEWASQHYVAYMMIALPFSALGSFLAFRSQRYNFVEHFVMAAFLLGQALVVMLLFFPLNYLLADSPLLKVMSTVVAFIGFGLNLWVNIQFFDKLSRVKVFWLTLLSYLIMTVAMSVLSAGGTILYLVFTHLTKA